MPYFTATVWIWDQLLTTVTALVKKCGSYLHSSGQGAKTITWLLVGWQRIICAHGLFMMDTTNWVWLIAKSSAMQQTCAAGVKNQNKKLLCKSHNHLLISEFIFLVASPSPRNCLCATTNMFWGKPNAGWITFIMKIVKKCCLTYQAGCKNVDTYWQSMFSTKIAKLLLFLIEEVRSDFFFVKHSTTIIP